MKIFKTLVLSVAASLSFASCSDWLDVNEDPNTPTESAAPYYYRLAYMEFYTNHAYMMAAMAANLITGDWTNNAPTGNQGKLSKWHVVNWRSNNVLQWTYNGAGPNINPTIESATAAGAWHYVGATYLIKAYNFMLLNDIFGEVPYSDAFGENGNPRYDTAKQVYQGVLDDLDRAIEYLSRQQDAGAMALSANDYWARGNVDTWIKTAYLLKARMLNKLTKKGEGSYTDYKWDADEILACLDKALKSNADNMIINHTDEKGTTTDNLGWNEQVLYAPLYSVIGMNNNYFITQFAVDNLTNFGGYGVEDPRADKIIPWARSQKTEPKKATEEGEADIPGSPDYLKWSDDGKWRRSVGVDMNTNFRLTAANRPSQTSWTDGRFTTNAADLEADTIYVHQKSGSKGYLGATSLLWFTDGLKGKGDERSATSGTFHTRASSQGYIATYAEACFIRAEVLMRRGDRIGAFDAYRDGVRAHIDMMNAKLLTWVGEDASLSACPSFAPIEEADIVEFIENGIGDESDISLAKIMTQKHIAMMFSMEQWNDMRRYDFSPEVFLNYHVPFEYYTDANAQLVIPMGKQPRRWPYNDKEPMYNLDNLNAIGREVEGSTKADGWYAEQNMPSIPIWWDSDQP